MTYGVINNNRNLYLHSLVPNNKLRQRKYSNVVDVLKSLWRELQVAYRKNTPHLESVNVNSRRSNNRTPNWNSAQATKKKTTAERTSLCPAKKKPSTRDRKTAVIAVFFLVASVCNSIQFFGNAEGQNTAFTMRTKPMKRGNYRRFEKIPPIRNGFPTKAIRRGSEPGSWQSKFSLCSSV